jgi:hypothetical protein
VRGAGGAVARRITAVGEAHGGSRVMMHVAAVTTAGMRARGRRTAVRGVEVIYWSQTNA